MRSPTLIVMFALAGCPGDDPQNGAVLYLAPDGSELVTKLIEELPPPY